MKHFSSIRRTLPALVVAAALAGAPLAMLPTKAHAVTQEEVDAAQERLNDLALQCALANSELEQTRLDTELTGLKIEELSGELDDKTAEYEEAQKNLRSYMAYSYKQGEATIVELVLSSRTFDQLISNIRYASDIADYGTEVVNTVNEVRTQMELERDGLEDVKHEQEERLAQQEVQAAELADAQYAQQAYLDGLSAELRAQIDLERAEQAAREEAERKAAEEAAQQSEESQETEESSDDQQDSADDQQDSADDQQDAQDEAPEQEEQTPEQEEQPEEEQPVEEEPQQETKKKTKKKKTTETVVNTDESDEARAARERVLSIARTQLGVPYQRCATQWNKLLDCSGFTYLVYQKAGYPIPRAQNQANAGKNSQCYYVRTQCVWKTDPADLEPGDLMFFGASLENTQHVGIYVGDGQTIEADGKQISYLTVWSPSSTWHHFLGGGSPIRKK